MTRTLNDDTERCQLTNDSSWKHVDTDIHGYMNKWADTDETNFALASTSFTLSSTQMPQANGLKELLTHEKQHNKQLRVECSSLCFTSSYQCVHMSSGVMVINTAGHITKNYGKVCPSDTLTALCQTV